MLVDCDSGVIVRYAGKLAAVAHMHRKLDGATVISQFYTSVDMATRVCIYFSGDDHRFLCGRSRVSGRRRHRSCCPHRTTSPTNVRVTHTPLFDTVYYYYYYYHHHHHHAIKAKNN